MIRRLAKVLGLSLAVIVFIKLEFMVIDAVDWLVKPLYMKGSYIASIDTPSYGNKVKEDLQYFSSLSNNEVVSFNKKHLYNRPIRITEKDDLAIPFLQEEEKGMIILGRTFGVPFSASIVLRKGMKDAQLKSTVIHEYLHAMGYEHTDDEFDLMYPYSNDWQNNFKEWADKLNKRLHRTFYDDQK